MTCWLGLVATIDQWPSQISGQHGLGLVVIMNNLSKSTVDQ